MLLPFVRYTEEVEGLIPAVDWFLAVKLNLAVQFLIIQALLFGRSAGAGCLANFWRLQGSLDQGNQALQGIGAILFPGAVAFGFNHQYPLVVDPPASQFCQACLEVFAQRGGGVYIEAQLAGGGHLVDVLTTGSACRDESYLYFFIPQGDFFIDLDCHTAILTEPD